MSSMCNLPDICSHHWELKQKFMEHHKDRFPEAELAGLAQVFGNIEFMGCQYPQVTSSSRPSQELVLVLVY